MAKNKQLMSQLDDIAKHIKENLVNAVEDKLLETYKENVVASFLPRTTQPLETYESTNTFLDSLYTEVEDISDTTSVITVMIANKVYPDSLNNKSTIDVHTYLTEGTNGGEKKYAYKNKDGEITYAHNYPTPRHDFENHTIVQIQGFLESLVNDVQRGKYNK